MSLSGTTTIRSLRLRGRPGRTACCAAASLLLGAVLLLGTDRPVSAQTTEELRAAVRRLRQVEASLQPLPNTGISRDVGQVAILEHDGSNYDARLADGTLNYEARTRVGLSFYETHADAYDFLVVFTNFPFQTNDATAFHLFGRNDVEGIGKPVTSAGPTVFGSPARLKGWIDMADVSQYRQRPFSLTPGERGFRQALDVLAHEMGHQWLAEATYVRDGATRHDLLGRDGVHWSYLLDSDASLLYGADWRDNGDGTFTAARVKERFSALDLYLMGLLPKEKVPPLLLLHDPAVDPTGINREGEVVAATGTSEILVGQLIEAMGPRRPDAVHSQKEFRLGFVFLTKPGTEPSPEDLEAVEQVRRAFGAHFFALTHGVAWADTTLVETPSGPRAGVPDLQRALAWLAAQQAVDGSWSDSAETRPRDTAAAVWALATAGASGSAWPRGLAWLRQAQPESLDFQARLSSALAAGASPAADRAARTARLLSSQNADGGFGAGADFASDALDTALALRALRALDHSEDGRLRLAVSALGALANPDGGWPAVSGGETSTIATAEVLLALLDWRETPGASALEASGLVALLARQNPDGGFGSSPSTAHATALALDVLLRAGSPGDAAGTATAWLEANQLVNGSWADSPYQTALVLSALRQSLGPNLVVPAGTLVVAPNPAGEGQPVQVTARVRNAGRAGAPATVARFYDGDPASAGSIGEAPVPALAPGEEAEVALSYPTQDRAGVRTLYVVADASAAVQESREDDNTASRPLTIVGKLADLVLGPEDVAVSPAGPEVGEGTTVAVTVHNAGERPAASSAVLVTVADAGGARVALPLASLPALAPGEAASVAFPWTPASAGRHVVWASADARYEIPETDETNGVAARAVQVVESVPAGPELALRHASVTPTSLQELPQPVEVRASVENLGRTPASSAVAVIDGRSGERVGVARVDVPARSAALATIQGTVSTAGSRELLVVADPEGEVPEEDETDNAFSVSLPDARTRDLEVSAASPSSTDVVIGELVEVTAEVRNRGTVDVASMPVQLAHDAVSGPAELARATVDLPAGESRTVVLSWRASITGDPVPLLLRVDPFDLVAERREDNNAVAIPLRVSPSDRPNLAVSGADVTIEPDPPVEGESATLAARIRNTGLVAAGEFAVRFFVGDPDHGGVLVGEASIDGTLEPGSSRTVSVPWSPVNARGSLGLFVVADPANQVEESDETDNRAFRPFRATGLADLVLTAADVTLDPGYPRTGEPVTIHATVRNLGGLPSAATSLRAVEGRADTATVVGVVPVPGLEPATSATLSLSWMPTSPPGDRPLLVEVDPDDQVVEQDEGNNASRQTVVVQDGDLYLTEPYFSPNGDGVKDETTLAWRATGRVRAEVSNAGGRVVRVLAADGPESGSLTWDGRGEHGVVVRDGGYTVTLTGEGGRVLARAPVELDTNRVPIHDVRGPAETALHNLTCALPASVYASGGTPAWMPGEDEALFVVREPQPGFPAGLLRVGLDGSHGYVVQDEWYRQAYFAAGDPVSPDGREVLVTDQPYWRPDRRLFAVDLATGSRRPVGDAATGSWSPDAQLILSGSTLLTRGGAVVASLCTTDSWECRGSWAWSPDGDRLAVTGILLLEEEGSESQAQLTVVTRDGTVLDRIPLPFDAGQRSWGGSATTLWRGDGRIVASIAYWTRSERRIMRAFVIDPGTRQVTPFAYRWWNDSEEAWWGDGPTTAAWSPDGSRYIDEYGRIWLEDGTAVGRLGEEERSWEVAPRSSRAFYWDWIGASRHGPICGGKDQDIFVASPVANLTAQLEVARLPGNTGLLLKGTAADRNFDRFQLDYASRDDPGTWHPIGPAFDAPVVDDILTSWAAPVPGTYVVRLRVLDRAGNARVLSRVVSWDRVPALANFTQSDYFLSPNGDQAKDDVTFRYLVLEPTRLDVRIVGPDRPGTAPTEVRRLALEYPEAGPRSFTWDGRDETGQVVPDGRYTVHLGDLPFRVEVDNTPPELDLAYVDPRVEADAYDVDPGERCRTIRLPAAGHAVGMGSVIGDRSWHVVDRNLRSWVLRSPAEEMGRGSDPVYVPETDGEGLPVLDAGRPRVRREGGRPVNREDPVPYLRLADHPRYTLEAEDLAGNRSVATAPPPAEGVWNLGAVFEDIGCKAFPLPAESPQDAGQASVTGLRPVNGAVLAGAALHAPPDEENVRFSFQPREGGAWAEVPLGGATGGGLRYLPIESFEALGIDPTREYRGRFLGQGEASEIASDSFLFRPCGQWLNVSDVIIPGPPTVVRIVLGAGAEVPLVRAWVHVWTLGEGPPVDEGVLEMLPQPVSGSETQYFSVDLRPTVCPRFYKYEVGAEDAAGHRYPDPSMPKACQRLGDVHGPTIPCTPFAVRAEQQFPGCGGSPDDLHLRVGWLASEPVVLEVEAGEGTVVAAAPTELPPTSAWLFKDVVVDAKVLAGGVVPVRVRLRGKSDGEVRATHESSAVVDRTPPQAEVLLPPEGGGVCASAGAGGTAVMQVLARGDDASPELGVQALVRTSAGAWQPLSRVCAEDDPGCDPTSVPSGRPFTLGLDVSGLDSGDYDMQLRLCDRSGNHGVTPRRFYLTHEPPRLSVPSVLHPVFSPNGDGSADETTLIARLATAVHLGAEVRRGAAGGPVVRTLFQARPYPATDAAATWDGRLDGGDVAPDGLYFVRFQAVDGCGNTREISTPVEVDTVAPEVGITEPAGGQRVSASVDVLGSATDAHFARWTLDVNCGSSPEWTALASGAQPAAAGSLLARWNTTSAPAGECRLRLAARDEAENQSAEAFATATVERGELLDALSATPDVFSPNGDGRRESATLGYALRRAARVRLEVRDGEGHVVRTFETGEERAAAAWSHAWDGLDDSGRPAAEGVHVLWVRAEDPAVATVHEEKAIRFDLDRSPPTVAISRPVPDGFVSPDASVRGSVTDRNLALFTVSAAGADGLPVEIARGSQAVSTERDLASLSGLAEGPHVLRVVASDTAENETQVVRPFLVDATPPRAAIQSPRDRSVLRRGDAPIAAAGLVTDAHLERWTLRFGAGAEPASFNTIGLGDTGGESVGLGSWDTRFIPDGLYTLSLVAADRAGLTAESRVAVTLDGTPPTVALTSPSGNGYVTGPSAVVGTAADPNLASWDLEWAPGEAAAAFRWSPLASGSRSVNDASLADWSPLPVDGVYTLRLTARDEVDLSATTRATVTVDTTPPAMPTGLAARVTRARDSFGDVVVTWNANTEPDLAGYRIERPREAWSGQLLASPTWDDGERLEGRYTYRVLAEDRAGNRSEPATLEVVVDLTPPSAFFSAPAEDASVSGVVDVRGTAWSADDFAEYRLFVGEGDSPVAWTLLRRSTAPVAAGTLGEWLALADGPFVLALEAEDTSGNEARVTRRVVVDTAAPEPPVLVEVAQDPAHADWLVPSWQPSPSPDVVGTLVHRNGRLANSPSVVIGDRRGYLVPGTSYEDRGLPDGEHCYRVVAMDAAGNESVPSNEICQSLDNRAPEALIVSPPSGTRFELPVRVIAETPDLDVASVRFEWRAMGAPDWVAFGEVPSEPPWATTLDPRPPGGPEMTPGDYELRAVATDRAGSTDLYPATIAVVYGDTTAPPAPEGLVARVDGTNVTLTWTPVDVPDFASYTLYRDGQWLQGGLTEPGSLDASLVPGTYGYTVTAVDGEGNESAPSAAAEAVVYEVRLEVPAWPVVSVTRAAVDGDGSRARTTVTVSREGAVVAEAPGTGGAFHIDDVPLVPDGNVLQARGEDAPGNRSVPSNEIVLISNAPPATVAGLEAQVDGSTVSLQWAPVVDADLVGYVVGRDGERLTETTAQDEAAGFDATSGGGTIPLAFDGSPATAWTPEAPGTGTWTLLFPAPLLLEEVGLRFAAPSGDNPGIPSDYTLLARWQGRDVPVLRVRGNTELATEQRLPAPFLTAALSVRLDSPGALAEVTVERLDPVPAGTESFADAGVPDGRHTYEVSAIDRYGAEGGAGATEAAVGDVDPPGSPTGLVATPIVRDVHLAWNASPEPDVESYVVLRDAARIGAASTPSYLDPGRPNGTYRYAVIAVDEAGHESAESAPADATVDVQPVPPSAPVILEPTDAAHPMRLESSRTDVAGRAGPGSVVALAVDGQPRGTAPAGPGFLPAKRVTLPVYWAIPSPDARWAAWISGADVAVQDLGTAANRLVPHGGTWATLLEFSPDGSTLALSRVLAGPGYTYTYQLAVARVSEGSVEVVGTGSVAGVAWSPDGTRLAASFYRDAGGSTLHVIDVATGAGTELGSSAGIDQQLRWSPDGTRLAFVRSWSGGAAVELRVLDLASSRTRVLDPQAWPSAPPSWSADGRRLAWTTAEAQPLRVRVQDLEQEGEGADVAEPGRDVVDGRFSPDGEWLSFVQRTLLPEGTSLQSVRAIHRRLGTRVTVREPQALPQAFDTHEWLGGRLGIRVGEQLDLYGPEAGRFVVRDVPLAPGENRLVARASDPTTGLESGGSETVLVTVPEEAFPDLAVVPEGILSAPPVPIAAQPVQLRVRVDNRGDADSGETDVVVRVVDPAGAVVVESSATLPNVVSGQESWLLVPWTPSVAAAYTVQVEVDPDGRVAEASEANNSAQRAVVVLAEEGLAAEVSSDRASYRSPDTAHVTVRLTNAATPFAGVARATVEDAAGSEVALLDERAVSLDWGKTVSYSLAWSTGTTPAGTYAFRARVRATGETEPAATAERPFQIEPGFEVRARVTPQPLAVSEGARAAFELLVENRSTNVALDGATARLLVRPEGTSGPAMFETLRTLPSLPTGGTWTATDVWPAAQPAGRYAVRLEVTKADVVLAGATAILTVAAAAPDIRGTLSVEPAHVLSGESAEARIGLENLGAAAAPGYPVTILVVSGPEATVHLSVPGTLDLAPGESRQVTLPIATGSLPAASYVVLLRGGTSAASLDRDGLVVHGLVAPPSPHAPADGARVDTAHPSLVVNDASSPEGAPLTYEFELFGDEGLAQALPGARGVPETPSRTSWPVAAGLAEDATYWWRARATDSFSTSAWSAVAAFTVDHVNRPPAAPVPDTPAPDARVPSRQPELVVRNAEDPERQPLTYEFRLAADEAMGQVVAGQAGVAEGPGLTSWTVTTILDEDAVYHWAARARTPGDAPEDFSPWSVPVRFRVDSVNSSPTAPVPVRPIGGLDVTTHTPPLVVENATDPEGDPLTYRFEVDTQPDFGSPERQSSPELGPGPAETEWTPPLALRENALHHWRAHASDGNTETPSAVASFFVDVVDEAPDAPVPLDPVGGRTVGTTTPTLRLRNATDPEGDPLTYELEVRDAGGSVVAHAEGAPSGSLETTWTVTPALAEDQAFTWSARAGDGELFGPWSAAAAFRVNAVLEPPTAPLPLRPADGAVVEERRPPLLVENATSPEGLPLTYAFEIDAVAPDGSTTPVERADGVAEGPYTTAWTPSVDLAEGRYQWRARASDPQQHGPWSATWRFDVLVDTPPAPPTGLVAVAGDARVRLDWNPNAEPGLTGYRVYRSTTAGGPYALVAAVAVDGHDDLGLTNGVTYYYVVTATDARAESGPSNEAAARPEAPQGLLAEVRYDPAVVRAECLLFVDRPSSPAAAASGGPAGCPDWLLATLELPAGHDPATIDVCSLRLLGSVTADPKYGRFLDVDRDGLRELQVRFGFDAVAPCLGAGVNVATIVGRAGASEVRGSSTIEVLALATELRVTPRTLEQRAQGQDVQARITFAEGVSAAEVSIPSVRLSGGVPVDRVVLASRNVLVVKFDRAAVVGVLPLGDEVEVRVTGTRHGLPFAGVDHIRVIE